MNQMSDRGVYLSEDINEKDDQKQIDGSITCNNQVFGEGKGIKRKRVNMTESSDLPTNDLEITEEDAGSSSYGVAHRVRTTSLDEPIQTESLTRCSNSTSEKMVTAEDTISVEVVCTNKLLDKDSNWVLDFHGSLSNNDYEVPIVQSNENCDADMLPTLSETENDENTCYADMFADNLLGEVNDKAKKPVSNVEVRNVGLEEENNFADNLMGEVDDKAKKPVSSVEVCNVELEEESNFADNLMGEVNDKAKKPVSNVEVCNVELEEESNFADNLMGEVDDKAKKPVSNVDVCNVELEEGSNFARVACGDASSQDSLQQPKEQSNADISLIQVDGLKVVTTEVVNECVNVAVDRAFAGYNGKKLLVLDVNGLIADICAYVPYDYDPDDIIMRKAVFKRPYCDDFLKFCFEKFNVGVWTSRTKRNVEPIIDFLVGKDKCKLLFCWDQFHCTPTGFTTVERRQKPLLLKKLKKLWDKCEPDLPWEMGVYNESNTLLLDDTPSKSLINPLYNAVFPYTYRFTKMCDNSLGPRGDLRIYLEGLAMAENVQEYVKQNPFGQRPITEKNLSWGFYLKVIEQDAIRTEQEEKKKKVIEASSTLPKQIEDAIRTKEEEMKVIETSSKPPKQIEQDAIGTEQEEMKVKQDAIRSVQEEMKVIEVNSTPRQIEQDEEMKVIQASSTPSRQTDQTIPAQQGEINVIEDSSTPPRQTEQDAIAKDAVGTKLEVEQLEVEQKEINVIEASSTPSQTEQDAIANDAVATKLEEINVIEACSTPPSQTEQDAIANDAVATKLEEIKVIEASLTPGQTEHDVIPIEQEEINYGNLSSNFYPNIIEASSTPSRQTEKNAIRTAIPTD